MDPSHEGTAGFWNIVLCLALLRYHPPDGSAITNSQLISFRVHPMTRVSDVHPVGVTVTSPH
jgi:hypothetical protein